MENSLMENKMRKKRKARQSRKLHRPLHVKGMARKISILSRQIKKLKELIVFNEEDKLAQISVPQEKHDRVIQKLKIEIRRMEFFLKIKNCQEAISMSEDLINRLHQTVKTDPSNHHAEEGLQIHSRILECRKERFYDVLMDQMRYKLAISKDGNSS